MLSKTTQKHVETTLAAAGHYGLDLAATEIPAIEWVCHRFETLARCRDSDAAKQEEFIAHIDARPDIYTTAASRADARAQAQSRRVEAEKLARLWRKRAVEVRACGLPADMLAKFGWRA